MAKANALEFQVKALDEFRQVLGNLDKNVSKLTKDVTQANKTIQDGSVDATNSLVVMNQALELVGKGFRLLKQAVEVPIQQFTTLFDLSKKQIEVWDGQVNAIARLAVSMKNSGELTKGNLEGLQDFAAGLQLVTTAGDEQILSGQALLGTFTGFGENLEIASRLALDLAAATGTSVPAAFQKMIQVVTTGSVTLGRAVLKLSDSKDAATLMKESFEVLEEKIGGTAVAVAQLGSGPLTQLSNAFFDVVEQVGRTISKSPEFVGFVEASKLALASLATDLSDEGALSRNAQLFGKLFGASFTIARIAGEILVRTIFQIATAVTNLIELLPGIDTPFQRSQARLNEIAEEIRDISGIYNNLADITIPDKVFDDLIEAQRTMTRMTEDQLKVFGLTNDEVEREVKLLEEAVKEREKSRKLHEFEADAARLSAQATEDAAEAVRDLLELFEKTRAKFLEDLAVETDNARLKLENLKTTAEEVIDVVGGESFDAADGLGDMADEADRVVAAFEKIDRSRALKALAEILGDLKGVQGGQITAIPLPSPITGGSRGAASTIDTSGLDQVGSELLGAAQSLNQGGEDLGAVADEIGRQAEEASNAAQEQIKAALAAQQNEENLANTLLSFSTGVTALNVDLGAAVQDLATAAMDLANIVQPNTGAFDRTLTKFKLVTDGFGTVIKGFAQVNKLPIPPGLQLGGIVNRPTQILAGEAGPEAILPLTASGQAAAERIFGLEGGASGVGLTINVTGNTFLGPEDLAEQVEEVLVDRLVDRTSIPLE